MRSRLLLHCLAVTCCLGASGGDEHARSGDYRITADASIAADAKQLAELTDAAIKALASAFPEWEVPQAIKASNLELIVHATPTDAANEGTATLATGSEKGLAYARLELLAPSRHPATARTNVGEVKDTKYFQRLLIHELSTIVFEHVSAKKPSGWRFHSAPSWFVQGLEQYVAFRQTAAKQSLQLYVERVRKDPSIVDTDFGLQVREPYIGGAVLLAFVDERYGWDKIQKLLLSTEATFGAAIKKELAITADTFAAEFQRWLRPK